MERWQQFYALFLKRFHHSKRNIKSLLTHILLPGIFISIAMTVALSQPKLEAFPKLVLSPTMFHPPPYYVPFSNSDPSNNLSKMMEESLYLPSGICSDCVLKSPNMTLGKVFIFVLVFISFLGETNKIKFNQKQINQISFVLPLIHWYTILFNSHFKLNLRIYHIIICARTWMNTSVRSVVSRSGVDSTWNSRGKSPNPK